MNDLADPLYGQSPSEPLYHYTSLDAVPNIVKEGGLWATDIRYFNDSAELAHTAALLESEIRSRPREQPRRTVLDQLSAWVRQRVTNGHALFVASLTPNGKKLHVAVNQVGVIMAQALTEDNVHDATTGVELVQEAPGDLVRVTADTAYDTLAFYDTAGTRGATVVVPPKETACVTGRGPRSEARDRAIEALNRAGRRQWKKDAGYHRQARVENTFFRYKTIIGGSLRARRRGGQETETVIACNVLNKMTAMGRPDSYAISQ